MKKLSRSKSTPAITMSAGGDAGSQLADIIERMNAIGDDPLQRMEMENLRRTYTAAAVRYFDCQKMTGEYDKDTRK